MNKSVLYLANGTLRLIDERGQSSTIESRFATDLLSKAVREQQRHAWKGQGSENKLLSGPALWGKGDTDKPIQISLTSIARGKDSGQFFYTLRTEHLCAILTVSGQEEQRVWNNNAKKLSHLSVHAELGHITCSVEHQGSSGNIAVRLAGESGLAEITEGDSMDTAPTWMPGPKMRILFQSAGVGRDRDGYVAALGPFSIQKLDVDTGEMETVLEDANFDFLTPKATADETLYYIRRPYEGRQAPSVLTMLKDFVLFPFRMAHAIFGYLNIFSMMYSGKQLKTIKKAGAAPMDMPSMLIWGNLLKAQKNQDGTDSSAYVPRSWKLYRKAPGQEPVEIASSVLCFDLAQDGTVIYSDGGVIRAVSPNGEKTKLVEDARIEQVVALG